MNLQSVTENHLARMLVYMVTVCTNCDEPCPMEIANVEKCLSKDKCIGLKLKFDGTPEDCNKCGRCT